MVDQVRSHRLCDWLATAFLRWTVWVGLATTSSAESARARVRLDMPRFACMLGGEDRQTLFMLAADWRIADSPADNMGRLTEGPRTGQVLTAPAPARGDGWP